MSMLPIHPTARRLGYQDSHGCCNGNEDQYTDDDDHLPLVLAHIGPARTFGTRKLLLTTHSLLLCAAWIWVDTALASGQDVSGGTALGRHGRETHLEVGGGDVDL